MTRIRRIKIIPLLLCLIGQTIGQLYEFSTFTFETPIPGGRGPSTVSQCTDYYINDKNATAPWLFNSAFFSLDSDFTTGIQLWTVPLTATYRITAGGGRGGGEGGGLGALVSGTFTLTRGQKLRILPGNPGTRSIGSTSSTNSGGGGGGSFVTIKNSAMWPDYLAVHSNTKRLKKRDSIDDRWLLVAGGGGGGNGDYIAGWTAVNPIGAYAIANNSTIGGSTYKNGGGVNGYGASSAYTGNNGCWGGGGGGLYTWGDSGDITRRAEGGEEFYNGGRGGYGGTDADNLSKGGTVTIILVNWGQGGFGGGGGASAKNAVRGGGGGGYSGGQGGSYGTPISPAGSSVYPSGDNNDQGYGAGGSSFNAGTDPTYGYNNVAKGFVTISMISCPEGFFMNSTRGTCLPCSPGTFKSIYGNSSCLSCSINTYTPSFGETFCRACLNGMVTTTSGSTSCTCPSGMTLNPSQTGCIACPDGTFKNVTGNATCTNCTANTQSYISLSGAKYCLACPNNTWSSPGSAVCNCNTGFIGEDDIQPLGQTIFATGGPKDYAIQRICTGCSGGTYAPTNGTNCLTCPSNTYSLSLASGCTNCSANSVSVAGSTKCVCKAGYFPSGNNCVACPIGYFKPAQGNSSCSPCLPGTFQNSTNGAVICTPCSMGTFQPLSSASTCNLCPVNTWLNTVGATLKSDCVSCGANSFSFSTGAITIQTCQPCAANSNTDLTPGICSCDSGFQGNGSVACSACTINTYKDLPGNGYCTACGVNATTYGLTGSTLCFCPDNYYGDPLVSCNPCAEGSFRIGATSTITVSADCEVVKKCAPGFYGNPEIACTACPINTYKLGYTSTITNIGSCASCPSNTITLRSGSSNVSQCICSSGYFGTDANCTPCAANTFKSTSGFALSCTTCPIHSSTLGLLGSKLIDACYCDAGYSGTASLGCSPCIAGFIKNVTGNLGCMACPAGTFQNLTAQTGCVKCETGTYQPFAGRAICLLCGINATSNGNGSTQCFCPPDHVGDPTDACSPCPPLYTRPGFISAVTSPASCLEPPKCEGGYYGIVGNCQPCPMNTYRSGAVFFNTTVANCTSCPQNSSTGSFTGASSILQCNCLSGFYGSGASECEPCPVNTYKFGRYDTTSCSSCPRFSITRNVTGATFASACVCENGYAGSGLLGCYACGANASPVSGTTQCECNAGYYPSGGRCLPCNAGWYKSSFGNTSCTPCTLNTYSTQIGATNESTCIRCAQNAGTVDVGSGSFSSCMCAPGYFGAGATGCFECDVNTYKEDFGNGANCTACPTELATNGLSGSTICNVCAKGYGGIAPYCVACKDGTEKFVDGNSECVNSSKGDNKNPIAALMGISDGVFYAIVAAVCGVLVAVVAGFVMVRRMKNKKEKLATENGGPRNLLGQPFFRPHNFIKLPTSGSIASGGFTPIISSQIPGQMTLGQPISIGLSPLSATLYAPTTAYSTVHSRMYSQGVSSGGGSAFSTSNMHTISSSSRESPTQ